MAQQNLLSTSGESDDEEDKNPLSWIGKISNGFSSAMQGVSSFFSTLFDVAFWGAVLVGAYYLARKFQEPIGNFLEDTCGIKDGRQIVTDLFVEGDKMIGEGMNAVKAGIASVLPAATVNKMAANMQPQEVEAKLTGQGVPPDMAGVLAKPDNWKQLVQTVSDAGGKITEPFAGDKGKAVLVATLVNQAPMVKELIKAMDGNALGGSNAVVKDLRAAAVAVLSDTTLVARLLNQPQVRDVLVDAAAKFSPVKFDRTALDTLLNKVAGDENAIKALQPFMAGMLNEQSIDKTQALELLSGPALNGVKTEMNALLQSLKSENLQIQSQIDQLKNPATQALINAVGSDTVVKLADAKTPDAALSVLLENHAKLLCDENVRDALLPLIENPTATKNAAIEFLAKADAKNFKAIGEFVEAIETKTENANGTLDPQKIALAKQLVALAQGDASQLNAGDVAAVLKEDKAMLAFDTLLDRLDVSSLPTAEQQKIVALRDHFYTPVKDGKPAHGIALALQDSAAAAEIVTALKAPAANKESPVNLAKQAVFSLLGTSGAGAWLGNDAIAKDLLSKAGVSPVLLANASDINALQKVFAPAKPADGVAGRS